MNILEEIKKEIIQHSNTAKAESVAKYFKTGKGEYGEGDIFLGITVPLQRQIAKKFRKVISISETEQLLKSQYHEERLTSLFILTWKFEKGDNLSKKQIFNLYLNNTGYINNWDLVDSSAHYIVGAFLWENNSNKDIIYKLAKSDSLWKKRIAIISTLFFIRKNKFDDALNISEILLKSKEDLIHKAVGWMLREIGSRDLETEEQFLNKHYKNMPRTMLRYAIEKFEEEKRIRYLKGLI